MELVITESKDEAGHGVLTLVGSMDLVTRQAVLDAGLVIVRRDGALTLDLTEVSFMDSTGIGALVELMNAAHAAGGRLMVSGRSARVARVLEATGLSSVWDAPTGDLSSSH
jgi:anti-sigma B factor antagonist